MHKEIDWSISKCGNCSV